MGNKQSSESPCPQSRGRFRVALEFRYLGGFDVLVDIAGKNGGTIRDYGGNGTKGPLGVKFPLYKKLQYLHE